MMAHRFTIEDLRIEWFQSQLKFDIKKRPASSLFEYLFYKTKRNLLYNFHYEVG
jgi:hypothetical protein